LLSALNTTLALEPASNGRRAAVHSSRSAERLQGKPEGYCVRAASLHRISSLFLRGGVSFLPIILLSLALSARRARPFRCSPRTAAGLLPPDSDRGRAEGDDGQHFIQYVKAWGGTEDPVATLIELDAIDEFRLGKASIDSLRSANARTAETNLAQEPQLRELQEAIRTLREGGVLEDADRARAELLVQKAEREQRYDERTLKGVLRDAAADSQSKCDDMERQPWTGAWEAPAFADKYLEEKVRQRRREKLTEKLAARMADR
jgi:hypothetical protein